MTVFEVGRHSVKVWRDRGRWGVAVDGLVHRHWFRTEAQAAGAGLLRANRLERAREGEAARQSPPSPSLRPTG